MPPMPDLSSYPECLRTLESYSHIYDLTNYNARLQRDPERHFLDDSENISLKVINLNERQDQVISHSSELEVYLDTYQQHLSSPSARVFLIQQQSSWGRLTINARGAKNLLRKLGAFPPFIDIIQSFGQKTTSRDESFATFRSHKSANDSEECAYLVRLVEEHGRPEPTERWSLRQCGVYYRSCSKLGHTFVILNPSKSLQLRLKDLNGRAVRPSAHQIQAAILSAAMENWRWCITDVEERCQQIRTKAQLTQVGCLGQATSATLGAMQFEDIQDIQVLQDKLELFNNVLCSDTSVITQVIRHSQQEDQHVFEDLKFVAVSEMNRVQSIVRRLKGTIDLVASILDYQSMASLDHNSKMVAEMTQVSNQENALLVELSRKASHDTDIVKTLTLVALIYLPASFSSSLMGMQYISIHNLGFRTGLHFKAEFWVFLTLTGILLLITLSGYGVWLRARKLCWRKDSMMSIANTP